MMRVYGVHSKHSTNSSYYDKVGGRTEACTVSFLATNSQKSLLFLHNHISVSSKHY